MRSIQPMRSSPWGPTGILLAFMALSSAAYAQQTGSQQTGFFVYPAPGAKYGSPSEVLIAKCSAYDAKKGGSQDVRCNLSPAKEEKFRSYTVTQPPEVMLFTEVAAGCWCKIGPGGTYVCVPPGCR
jgi:hypothetical protein